ncbi:phage shock protein A (IM30), suppresses sigma54-dependent transcription [Bernardetia litoralis DSM 6794]|uniref:Phage shock protein A (IM30), suppresses sigma54-dependent transcription n=1 Tax=Bernardetia litoralis (strain ATCC 23117 / DSM 6794 / NBRC 15988 / NCIMB 1366 / Fx l1 / Sio-4) TaxID=880071 RepID=I4AKI1_BERLS|nr:PspA/IM30 family protein [Bernardetia litoralis]AFM04466.1 phage shock protein A (IM30), suppresses sigma54-dependent transcription [Bernardetia litoralis DSM 6794]
MWIFFKRLFRIGKTKAHSKLDKVEDPVALTEQSIKDLKQDLAESMKSLAEMKALAIRTKRDVNKEHRAANQYEQRAMQFLTKAEKGDITEQEADNYAIKALAQKDQILRVSSANEQNLRAYENMIRKLEIDIQKIRTQINTWEGELKTLKVRSRLSETSRRLNERMSSISNSSMSNMLEDMKTKVEEQEALAQSYEDVGNLSDGVDDEVDKVLGKSAVALPNLPSPQDALAQLKEKMKASPKTTDQLIEEAEANFETKKINSYSESENNEENKIEKKNITFTKVEKSTPPKRPRLRIRKEGFED